LPLEARESDVVAPFGASAVWLMIRGYQHRLTSIDYPEVGIDGLAASAFDLDFGLPLFTFCI